MKKKLNIDKSFNEFITEKGHSEQDTFVAFMDGDKMTTLKGLYNELESSLKFPDYFGGNWNAVDDCMTDLSWINEKKYLIAIANFQNVLSEYEFDINYKKEDMTNFIGSLIDAIKYWHTPDCPDEWFGHTYRDFDVYIQERGEVYKLEPDS